VQRTRKSLRLVSSPNSLMASSIVNSRLWPQTFGPPPLGARLPGETHHIVTVELPCLTHWASEILRGLGVILFRQEAAGLLVRREIETSRGD